MTHLKRSLALVCVLFLSACNSVKGTMEVLKPFAHQNGSNETITFQPGKYEAKLKLENDHQATITVAYPSDKDKTKINFVLPEGEKFPEYAGDIEMSAAQLGQAYDMKGHVETKETRTEVQRTSESCTYTVQEPVCGPNGCHYQPVTRPGWQQVEFYYHNTDTSFTVGLLAPASAEQLARFSGNAQSSRKIYTYQGICL